MARKSISKNLRSFKNESNHEVVWALLILVKLRLFQFLSRILVPFVPIRSHNPVEQGTPYLFCNPSWIYMYESVWPYDIVLSSWDILTSVIPFRVTSPNFIAFIIRFPTYGHQSWIGTDNFRLISKTYRENCLHEGLL